MSDISTGHIYIITCTQNPNIFYIGSTFNQLRHRMQSHKATFKAYMNGKEKHSFSIFKHFETYGIENFNINLIKSYKVIRTHNKDCKHLHMYEQLWMNKFKKCCNEKTAFNPLYYYKTIRNEHIKAYNEQNKTQILEKQKAYRKKNREKVNEQKRAKYEQNKTHILEQQRAWREKNREKVKEQKRASYHRNKNK